MKTQHTNKSFLGSNGIRIAALGLVLIIIAIVTIIATENDGRHTNRNVIHIEVNSEGGIGLWPGGLHYSLEENNNGDIFIRFLIQPEFDGVTVNLPHGWSYQIYEVYTGHNYDNHINDSPGYVDYSWEDNGFTDSGFMDYGYIGYDYPSYAPVYNYYYDYENQEMSLTQQDPRHITVIITPGQDPNVYDEPAQIDGYQVGEYIIGEGPVAKALSASVNPGTVTSNLNARSITFAMPSGASDIDFIVVPTWAASATRTWNAVVNGNGTLAAAIGSAEPGDTVTLILDANPSFNLTAVSVAGASINQALVTYNLPARTITFTMPAGAGDLDITITPSWTPTVTARAWNAAVSGTGTLVATTGSAEPGDAVTLTLNINAGFNLTEVSIAGADINQAAVAFDLAARTVTFIMPDETGTLDITITPSWTPRARSWNAAVSGTGTLAVATGSAEPGDTITLILDANPGFILNTVSVAGAGINQAAVTHNLSARTLTFTMPAGAGVLDITVTPAWTATATARTWNSSLSGTGTLAATTGSAEPGSTVTLALNANTGFNLSGVSVAGTGIDQAVVTYNLAARIITFTMPAGAGTLNVIVTPIWTPIIRTWNATVNGTGTLAITTGSAEPGDTIMLTLNANPGYILTSLEIFVCGDIIPIPGGAGRILTFDPNGGTVFGIGHGYRHTIANATIGVGNMPYAPLPPTGVARFGWWSREPDGRDPLVPTFGDREYIPTMYVPEDGLTVYAIWIVSISFFSDGITLPIAATPTPPPLPATPPPPTPFPRNIYNAREVPRGWSIDEAETFGFIEANMPYDPTRQSFQFWGWYNMRISPGYQGFPPTQPPGVASVSRLTPVFSNTEFFARWRLHTHLVMFDMNHNNAVLAVGTDSHPQRLYRWVLDNRSIVDSGLGGNANGRGGPAASGQLDGAPWIPPQHTGRPDEYYRQNIRRPWFPNEEPGDPGHIPRWNPDGTANAFFTTPYYPGSGLVRGNAAGVIGTPPIPPTPTVTETGPNAATAWPRSAPNVYMGYPDDHANAGQLNQWTPFPRPVNDPFPGTPLGSNAVPRPRYTLEGWWTTPDGWAQNWNAGNMDNIVGRRFAPAGFNNSHTGGDHTAGTGLTSQVNPVGFPIGLARIVNDRTQPPLPAPRIPVTGIVSGGQTQATTGDITVYAQWVFRVTFNLNIDAPTGGDTHGVQDFSLAAGTNFNPGTSRYTNFRDIPANLPSNLRTISQSGQRIRANQGTFQGNTYTWHEPISAGMPPASSPVRSAHVFNSWWDRPVPPIDHQHHLPGNCSHVPTCTTVHCFPINQHGALQITGNTQVDGNMTAYAHWRSIPAPNVHVRFHLNADPATAPGNESVHGNAYWPTGRPMQQNNAVYDNQYGRFFLNRLASGTAAGQSPSQPAGVTAITNEQTLPNSAIPRYTHLTGTGNIAQANVYYGDRYAEYLTRTIAYGNIPSQGHLALCNRFPRNPRRTGYIFVGWATVDDLPPFAANGNPTPIATGTAVRNDNAIWNVNTPITNTSAAQTPAGGTLNLYAVWAPAIDIILDGNSNTAPLIGGVPRTQFVRPMPFDPAAGPSGGGFTFNEMIDASRWGSGVANGMTWFPNMYTHSSMRSIFTRTNFVAINPTNSFNTHQPATMGHGSMILATTRFNDAFFDLFPANNLVPVTGGNDKLRVYIQWGTTLTFNSNFSTFDPSVGNIARVVNMPSGQSINDVGDVTMRHSHLPTRADMFGAGGGGNWQGTPGVDGTRGGWPRDPRPLGRNFDSYDGDWFALFTIPMQRGWSLIGWHRRQSGICPPTCDFDECWFTADTVITNPITIFAIWGPYVEFHPGLGGANVDMDPVKHDLPGPPSFLHYRVLVGHPFPTPSPLAPNNPPLPGNPVWPDHEFIGWFPIPNPDPTDPGMGATMFNFNLVQFARRYYAVWSTVVIFDPTGPPGSTAATGGGSIHSRLEAGHPVGDPLERAHTLGRYINIIPGGGEFAVRPGWPNEAFSGYWFAVNPDGTRRRYHPNVPIGSGSGVVMQHMRLFPEWISTITFRPGHERARLDGLATNANVVRTVPDGFSMNPANAVGQRTPTAAAAVNTALWPNDPGLNFGGWRRVNAAGQPLNADGTLFTPTPGAAWPALWDADQINNMVAAGPRYYFEAVWSPRIEFFKVGNVANAQHPLGFNTLQGARFVLDRYVAGIGWQQAYPAPPAPLAPATFVESDANGRVFISNTFAPLLELSRGQVNTTFRLREIQAPDGFRTPPGHWDVIISYELGVLPQFVPQHGAALNPYLIVSEVNVTTGALAGRRQILPNIPYLFNFLKVDYTGNPLNRLAGAHFQLLVYNGTGTPVLPAGIVTPGMIGSGPNQWSQVGAIHETTTTSPMSFNLTPGRYYHLIELVPPPLFRAPFGQWRLQATSVAFPGVPTLTVTPMGGDTMPIISPTTPAGTFVIPNWPDFELPLTGGLGVTAPGIAGGVIIGAATLAALAYAVKKKKIF